MSAIIIKITLFIALLSWKAKSCYFSAQLDNVTARSMLGMLRVSLHSETNHLSFSCLLSFFMLCMEDKERETREENH